ncbi:MAG TPA: di-heme-cytochrome C peroxidase [Terriglobales bacterium]|nr:di-heme-cytochrome C peroxidase [Terriglobales bacterium]
MKNKFLWTTIGLLAAMTGCSDVKTLLTTRPSEKMPAYKPVSEVYFPDQTWTADRRQWFYHSSQGTVLLPYKWFMALEQPKLKVFGTVPRFNDTEYLARFGFLPGKADYQNPDGLPVGLAKGTVADPVSGQPMEVVGLTCAACHTGQLEYQGKGVRVDGGSATIDLSSFQTELGFAVGFTGKVPFRFGRFAKAVLGDNDTPEARAKLKEEFEKVLTAGLDEKSYADKGDIYPTAGGFGRTDALGRIGNFVFGTELDNKNLRVADAPVSFPPLWNASWLDWVQYNGSIQGPMVRNIGEALGVRARVNLTNVQAGLYRSTVNVQNLHEMESQLGGKEPLKGLQPPPWPEQIFGPIDRAKAARGKDLYEQHCQKCHLPPTDSPGMQDVQSEFWTAGLDGHRFLKTNLVPVENIGTDPAAADNWAKLEVITGALNLGSVKGTEGLRVVTDKIAEQKYKELNLSAKDQMEWNGYRDDGVRAPRAYRARLLEGIWATPPYLHNGSVPSLYQMLIPADRRDKVFYLGSREFDPRNVGFATTNFEGAFEFRNDVQGNSNAGHEFKNAPLGNGVIGPELSDDERWALIEYLKVIGQPESK